MSSDFDQEATRLNADYAVLKREHEQLSAAPHTVRDLEAHVARLRVHIQRLQACIEQMRHRSSPLRDTTVAASEGSDTSSAAPPGRAEPS
jgi:division protein CdvB (Snf7/Vps24/ESCRT-III family)